VRALPTSCAVSTVVLLGPLTRSTDLHLLDLDDTCVRRTVTLPGERAKFWADPCKKHCPSDAPGLGTKEADWQSCLCERLFTSEH
jgi:hypothetical protein